MTRNGIKLWLAVVIIAIAVVGAAFIFQGEKPGEPEEPLSLLSMDDALKIAGEHADTFNKDVKEETLELIFAELCPVVEKDGYYTADNVKITYENQPQSITRQWDGYTLVEVRMWPVGDYNHPEIHIHGIIPSKVWVVEFNCNGWITHWGPPLLEPPPLQTISGFKVVLDAYTGKIIERYYRLENLIDEDDIDL